MAGRIYGTLRPAEAMGNRSEDFVARSILPVACRKLQRISRRWVRFQVALGRDMGAYFGIGRNVVWLSYLLVPLFALISSAATARAPQVASPTINVMPLPAPVRLGAGRLMLVQTFSVAIRSEEHTSELQ